MSGQCCKKQPPTFYNSCPAGRKLPHFDPLMWGCMAVILSFEKWKQTSADVLSALTCLCGVFDCVVRVGFCALLLFVCFSWVLFWEGIPFSLLFCNYCYYHLYFIAFCKWSCHKSLSDKLPANSREIINTVYAFAVGFVCPLHWIFTCIWNQEIVLPWVLCNLEQTLNKLWFELRQQLSIKTTNASTIATNHNRAGNTSLFIMWLNKVGLIEFVVDSYHCIGFKHFFALTDIDELNEVPRARWKKYISNFALWLF